MMDEMMDRGKLNKVCGVDLPCADNNWEIIAAWFFYTAGWAPSGPSREQYEDAKRRLGVE